MGDAAQASAEVPEPYCPAAEPRGEEEIASFDGKKVRVVNDHANVCESLFNFLNSFLAWTRTWMRFRRGWWTNTEAKQYNSI